MEFVVEIKITYFFIRKDITFDLCTFHIIGVLFFFVYVFLGGDGYSLPPPDSMDSHISVT